MLLQLVCALGARNRTYFLEFKLIWVPPSDKLANMLGPRKRHAVILLPCGLVTFLECLNC